MKFLRPQKQKKKDLKILNLGLQQITPEELVIVKFKSNLWVLQLFRRMLSCKKSLHLTFDQQGDE